ncbi:hypothetical protein [Hoyosella subflava]|nr:hypothetical protein [Hoyosella subflava]
MVIQPTIIGCPCSVLPEDRQLTLRGSRGTLITGQLRMQPLCPVREP